MDSVKINTLEFENVKRIRAVALEPSASGLTVIGGNNNQGKTSILDTIAWALGGDRYKPSNPVRDGSTIPPRIKITLSNGLIVERSGKNSSLKVTDPNGKKSGQQLLNSFVEELALNLPKFMEQPNREKANTLLQIIGVGDQLHQLERQETELYKLKSIKPAFGYIGILWKEEKDQMKGPEAERSVNQSVLRGGDIAYDFSSYNPPKSKQAWVNKEKLIPNDKRVIHSCTYLEAPPEWLGQKFIDDAEHLKEVNPTAYEHEYLGVPNGDGGNVFEFLEIREITDKEIESMDRIHQGVDWGWYPDQYAFLRTHYDSAREKIYLIDELYVNKWKNDKTGKWIADKGYDDYDIICDSAEPKSVGDYRDMNLPARGAKKGPGSVEYGFKWLQSRTLVIDPKRTPGAYKEIIGYEYERDKDGNVVSGYPDGNDHAISALRYAYEPIFNRRGNRA